MSDNKSQDSSPFGAQPSGGRLLLAGLLVASIILLMMIGNQTSPGDMGEAARSGGWWAEPALAPGIALALTVIASVIACFFAKPEKIAWMNSFLTYARIALLAGIMIGTVYLMKVLGFALSILVFSGVVSFVAGFRGVRLVAIPLLATIAMVLVFRVGFSIWFPRPMLFKWIDLPFWLQGIF